MGCSGSAALDCDEDETPVPARFWARLHRGADDLVGAVLGDTDSGAVLVCVKEGGIFDKWNKSNPGRAIRPGYIIEEINGVRGYWNLLDVLRNQGPLVCKVATVPPESAGPDWFEEIAATAKESEESAGNAQFMVRLQQEDSGFVLPGGGLLPSPRGLLPSPTGKSPRDRSVLAPLPGVTGSAAGVGHCAICQEDVRPDENLVQLPCGHAYHALCCAQWLVRKEKVEEDGDGDQTPEACEENAQVACPLCRRELVSNKKGVARSIEVAEVRTPQARRQPRRQRRSPR